MAPVISPMAPAITYKAPAMTYTDAATDHVEVLTVRTEVAIAHIVPVQLTRYLQQYPYHLKLTTWRLQ